MKRISQLDGLRGVAVLMVFVYHGFQVPLLWSGVDLFFVLSGYLITGILLRSKQQAVMAGTPFFGPFYVRRARRILPPYVILLLLVSMFFTVPWSRVWFWYAFFAANLANALSQVGSPAFTPLWSLAVEEQFYFIWPWAMFRLNHKELKKIALGIVLLAPLSRAIASLFVTSQSPIYTLTPFRADTLAFGAFVAISEYEDPEWSRVRRHAALICATVCACVLFAASAASGSFRHNANSISFNTFGYSLIVMIVGATLIYVLGSDRGFAYRLLTAAPLRYLGLISYTFYLYHLGVLIVVARYLHSTTTVTVVGFAITAAIASLSWTFLESRILGKRSASLFNPLIRRLSQRGREWSATRENPPDSPSVAVVAPVAGTPAPLTERMVKKEKQEDPQVEQGFTRSA